MSNRPAMHAAPPPANLSAAGAPRRWQGPAAAALIATAALIAYHNSFSGPFVFDDTRAILGNPTIRSLRTALFPPAGSGLPVSGRPLLNLSFALNYALGGTSVWGYHAANLALHILAGLTLFGIVRRTLQLPAVGARLAPGAWWIAPAVALLWIVHPLQTESVTYVVQRAESLAALCYLLTLYAFIRGVESPQPGRWQVLAILACLCGMAAKETVVTAPLVVLLYDRTFIAGSFRDAWRRRRAVYLGLAGTWLLLAALVAATGGRGHTAGFGASVDWRAYAFTQCGALLHYLKLAIWPHPLVLDYGNGVVTGAAAVLPHAVVLCLLAAATLAALGSARWRRLGFLGASFFAVLAPTSSVLPVATQTVAEHRMYLPLAAVIALGVLGLHALAGRRGPVIVAALAVALGVLTIRRNADYRSAVAIWTDTAAKCPGNARALSTLADALARTGRAADAISPYEQALQLTPDNAEVHGGLGNALVEIDRLDEALPHFTEAVRLAPDDARMRTNLGNALLKAGRLMEATAQQRQAVRLNPAIADVHFNLANTLALTGAYADAVGSYRQALRLSPDFVEARFNLGNALATLGRLDEAAAEYRAALKLDPALVAAWCSLGDALAQSGRIDEAAASYEEALRRAPDSAEARDGLARLRAAPSTGK